MAVGSLGAVGFRHGHWGFLRAQPRPGHLKSSRHVTPQAAWPLMPRWDSLSSPSCPLRTRIWASVVSPHIRSTRRPHFIAATFTALLPLARRLLPCSFAVGGQAWHPGAAGRGVSSLHIWCFLIGAFPFALEAHVRSGGTLPRCQGPLGIEALGCPRSTSVACSPHFHLGCQKTGFKHQHGHILVM